MKLSNFKSENATFMQFKTTARHTADFFCAVSRRDFVCINVKEKER